MTDQLTYKGFVGTVNYCDIDSVYHGRVLGIPRTSITYHGKDMDSLYADFVEAIEFYLSPDMEDADNYIASLAEPMTG